MNDNLPPLPEPKYIYHRSDTPGEDDLFEFAECGAVDTDSEGRVCQGCERLYAAYQVEEIRRAAILAERERWTRLLSSGHIPGAAWGTRFKLVKVDPMYGEESELSVSALTAAIRENS